VTAFVAEDAERLPAPPVGLSTEKVRSSRVLAIIASADPKH